MIVKREISGNTVMLNFYHFFNHKCVVFLFVSVPLTKMLGIQLSGFLFIRSDF